MFEHKPKSLAIQVVPDPEYAKVWAGKQTKQQLDALEKVQFTPRSSPCFCGTR
jgi:hypothetical protein